MDNWQTVCSAQDLVPNIGACASVLGEQVAIFSCTRTDSLYAISNFDPIGDANVLSRGIIGCIDGQPYVASPLYKQHFHLETGACLEEPEYQLKTYPIRVMDDAVQVMLPQGLAA